MQGIGSSYTLLYYIHSLMKQGEYTPLFSRKKGKKPEKCLNFQETSFCWNIISNNHQIGGKYNVISMHFQITSFWWNIPNKCRKHQFSGLDLQKYNANATLCQIMHIKILGTKPVPLSF